MAVFPLFGEDTGRYPLKAVCDEAKITDAQTGGAMNLPQFVSEEEMRELGMDGKRWADAFCRTTGFPDPEWALGWFCNAIMAGYDEAMRRSKPSPDGIR